MHRNLSRKNQHLAKKWPQLWLLLNELCIFVLRIRSNVSTTSLQKKQIRNYFVMTVKDFCILAFTGLFAANVWALGLSDQGGDINKRDEQHRKQGKWITFGKDRPSEGFPPEGKIEEGHYKDDRKEGVWIKYWNDGFTKKLSGEYRNNRPSGRYTKYYSNGQVRETGIFDRNNYYDSLKRFHENGVLEYEGFYNDSGNEHGTIKFYYPNGQEEFVYTKDNGKLQGKATRYHENGDVKEVIYYDESGNVTESESFEMTNPPSITEDPGQSRETAPRVDSPRTKGVPFRPNGYNKVYDDGDEIWQDGDFRNGRLWEGKVYEYDQDGILLRVKVFRKGLYHSDGQL